MPNARSVTTYRDLLGLWPSQDALAADLAVSFTAVNGWRRTGRVPREHWPGLVASARRRGITGVSLTMLARLPSAAAATSFRDILSLWPAAVDLARDLELPTSTVRSWQERGRIPLEYWGDLIASGRSHGIRHLTYSRLQNIALAGTPTRRRKVRRQSPTKCVTDASRVAQDTTPRSRRREAAPNLHALGE
jgi:hypothetical protein